MTRHSLPDWAIPPEGGFTAEDLDRLPDLPAHAELIDGSLVLVSPQRLFHMTVIDLLLRGLRLACPPDLRVYREMTVTLGPRQRPEPDVLVVNASAVTGPDLTTFAPADVLLAVEVVSPDSEERDRRRKPELYAEAAIPYFWLVEEENGRPVVFSHTLDPVTRRYVADGVHRERLELSVPYAIDIDLTETDRL